MQPVDPPTIKHAGAVVFPDVDYPLPIKLAAFAAMAWIVFGPLLIGVAARRRQPRRAVAIYAGGVVLATAFFTFRSGLMGEGLAPRIGVWARHIWVPHLVIGVVLALMAAGVGRLSRRFWPARIAPD